jgi:hypothetical protein
MNLGAYLVTVNRYYQSTMTYVNPADKFEYQLCILLQKKYGKDIFSDQRDAGRSFSFAGPKNASSTTSSGATQSDRAVHNDANLA